MSKILKSIALTKNLLIVYFVNLSSIVVRAENLYNVVNMKGVDFGVSNAYSKAKKFKTYRRVKDVKAKFAVYTKMSDFLRYETETKRITTTHYIGI